MCLQAKLSYAASDDAARRGAHEQWATNVLPSSLAADLTMPEQFSDATRHVRPEDMDASVRISSSLDRHVEWLREYLEMGFDRLYLHNVNRQQVPFIEAFGASVLPLLEPARR